MKGKILVASPELLLDEIFSKTVILITDRHDEGTVGFVLNKPLAFHVSEVSENLKNLDYQLWEGGPVATENLYFLHNLPGIFDENLPVTGDIFWSGDFERLEQLSHENPGILNGRAKFFLGYSGWSPGQLEREIQDGAWLVIDRPDFDIFNLNPRHIWAELIHRHKPQWDLWRNAPSDPGLN